MKGLGITALVIAIGSLFIPFIGAYTTVLSGLLAAFGANRGFSLSLAALAVNVINIIIFSPTMWITTGLLGMGAVLLGIQVIALIVLLMINSAQTQTQAQPPTATQQPPNAEKPTRIE